MSAVPMDNLATPLAYALAYAKLGWKVLPLEPHTKRPHRIAPRGLYSATSDAKSIREMWTAAPDAGIGIACRESGLVVLDIDPRNGGLLTLEQLEAQHGPISSDVQAITPGGGLHLFYSAPSADMILPGTLGPGVDVKWAGYVCVEPSIHPNGKTYGWEASSSPLDDAKPSPLPTLLGNAAARPTPRLDGHDRYVPVTEQQWGELYSALRKVPADDRDTWLRVGMALHSTGEPDRAFQLWCEWSQSSPKYDARDQMRVWRSFRGRGIDGVTYRAIFAIAQPDQEPPVSDPDGMILTIDQLARRAQGVRWLVKGFIPADSVGFFFGASGTFKSFVALDLSLHLAHGLPWLGRKTAAGPVVYTAAEGGLGLFRRVQAWHQHRQMKWDAAQFLVCPFPILLGDERQAKAFVEAIEALGVCPALVVVDTMAQTYSGDENSAQEVSQYLRALGALIRARFGCAVLVIHHSGHSATERPRGSSALTANSDFLYGVFRDEDEHVATLECVKVKDGDRPPQVTFGLEKVTLGHDDDGDQISSLVARHLDQVGKIIEAAGAKATGNRARFLQVCQHGEYEQSARDRFYESLGEAPQDTKKKAWQRCLKWAIDSGILDVVRGSIVLMKGADE